MRIKQAEQREDHCQAQDASNKKNEILLDSIIRMRNQRDCHKAKNDSSNNNGLASPLQEHVEMAFHPCANIEEQEVAPRHKAQETKHIRKPLNVKR